MEGLVVGWETRLEGLGRMGGKGGTMWIRGEDIEGLSG
jgi:hypothetical protein